jgi:HD superfamily phosphodiesterase
MKCPGQDTKYWKPGSIFEVKCPKCGGEVEFFKDDTTRKCGKCGHMFVNPKMDFGCAAYCQYAEQCLGTLPQEMIAKKQDFLKDRVAIEMKKYFKQDFRRIGHATRVARYAERIGKNEGANMAVVLCAAYLHDIGIHESERKYNSTAPKYQELEGPLIAKNILIRLGANEQLIEEVCDIVGHHHHPRPDETLSFKIVYDADRITNLEDNYKARGKTLKHDKLSRVIEKSFLTQSGKEEARKVLEVRIEK